MTMLRGGYLIPVRSFRTVVSTPSYLVQFLVRCTIAANHAL